MTDLCWVDGRIVPATEPVLTVGDSAFFEGRGCYSTGRWTGTGVRYADRHLARLRRDAAALGIGEVCAETARRAFQELGREAFGKRPGIIRLQASRDATGRVQLTAIARAVGPEPGTWRAVTLPFPHEGATPYGGAKVSNRLVHTLAGDRVRGAGVDEGLLFDASDRLVEGTRANLVTVGADGRPRVAPSQRGAVAGVALEVVAEHVPDLERADRTRAEMPELRELVALNAVRGAAAIVELDGRPVGDGAPGPWAARLRAVLDEAS